MKQLLFIGVSILFCFTAKSQDYTQGRIESDTIYGYEPTMALNKAGLHLKKAYKIHQSANILQLSGLAVSTIGVTSAIFATDNPEMGLYIASAGAAMTLISWVVNTTANKHLGAAADYMRGVVPINHSKKQVIYKEF